MAQTKANANEVIKPEDVKVARRGRTPNVNSELLDFLRTLAADGSEVGVVKQFGPQESKEDKGKIAGIIRNHWVMLGRDKPSIRWNPDTNFPQVQGKKSS